MLRHLWSGENSKVCNCTCYKYTSLFSSSYATTNGG